MRYATQLIQERIHRNLYWKICAEIHLKVEIQACGHLRDIVMESLVQQNGPLSAIEIAIRNES